MVNYTTWPENTFATAESPIIIGILGNDPFGELLDKTLLMQQSKRRLVARRIHTVSEALQCQVVFIDKTEHRSEAEWLEKLKDHPVLTIGESGQTLSRGGVLEFVFVNARYRYDASWPSMVRAGLKLSAPILNSARKIRQFPNQRP